MFRTVYQVLNKYGSPASRNDGDDLAMYPTREKAEQWIGELVDDLGAGEREDFHVVIQSIEVTSKMAELGSWG